MTEQDATAPVVIVGAGPAGVTAALLLARRGIRTTLLERRMDPLHHPAAHVINARSLEIWREYSPDLAQRIADMSPPHHEVNLISWFGDIRGEAIGSIDLLSDPERKAVVESQSPYLVSHVGQHLLMPALWEVVEDEPLIDFRRGVTVTEVVSRPGGVVVATTTGDIRARYVLACDGANSPTRDAAGVEMTGPVLANMGSVFFTSHTLFPDDARPLLAWIYTPELCGVLISHAAHRYILMTAYLHPAQEIATDSRRFWQGMLPKVVGDADIDIESTGTWIMTSQTATTFRTGRMFLLGDAAHRFPHTGGFGLNSGVQDAHNLAWKLDAVLSGTASDALLDTYEVERRPVVGRFADQSVHNHFRLDAVGRHVGVVNKAVRTATEAMRRRPLSALPGRPMAKLMEAATRLQTRRARLLDPSDPRSTVMRQTIADEIPGQVEHFVSTGLQFGYLYDGPLIAADDGPRPPEDVVDYVPTTYPGARLPHLVVDVHGGEQHIGIHDLIDPNTLTLFTCDAELWNAALAATAMPGPGIAVVGIAAAREGYSIAELLPEATTGAVVVRPDGHVFWRTALSASAGVAELAAEAQALSHYYTVGSASLIM